MKNLPPGFKKKLPPRPGTIEVDCLGPDAIDRPHKFRSTSRSTHRICPKCRDKQNKMNLSFRACEPTPVAYGDPTPPGMHD